MAESAVLIRGCRIAGEGAAGRVDVLLGGGRSGRIEKIGGCLPAGTARTGELEVIDAEGLYLLPGLVDCHVHLVLDAVPDMVSYVNSRTLDELTEIAARNAEKTLMAGITTVRDMGDVASIARRLKESGDPLRTPRIFTSGRMITSPGGHVKTISREAAGGASIRDAVDEQAARGVDFIKLIVSGGLFTPGTAPERTEMDAETVEAAVDAARRHGLGVAAHAYSDRDVLAAVSGGVRSVEHGYYATPGAFGRMARSGVYLVPTIKAPGAMVRNSDALPAHAVKNAASSLRMAYANLPAALEEGVGVAMGTDAGTPFNEHGQNAEELEYLAGIGMSNRMLLDAATAVGAGLLGLSGELGRVAVGYLADLLLVGSDPLDDIMVLRRDVRYVIKGGVVVRRPERPGI